VLADKKGSRTLFVDRTHTLATISRDWITAVKRSGRFSSHNWTDQMSVPTTTLDALIEKYGKPAFCKIDVEGFEFDVLRGLSHPISVISIEFVSERVGASADCINYITRLGKAEFNYCLGASPSFALPRWVDVGTIQSLLTTMDKDIKSYGDLYARFVNE